MGRQRKHGEPVPQYSPPDAEELKTKVRRLEKAMEDKTKPQAEKTIIRKSIAKAKRKLAALKKKQNQKG